MKTLLLKSLKYLYSFAKSDTSRFGESSTWFSNKSDTSDLISQALLSNEQTIIARSGSVELHV